jgi:PleD family two-component response regulator
MTTFKEPANILLVDDDSRNLDVLDSILACPLLTKPYWH